MHISELLIASGAWVIEWTVFLKLIWWHRSDFPLTFVQFKFDGALSVQAGQRNVILTMLSQAGLYEKPQCILLVPSSD